ncbi:L,D-transpeptidase family protein [Novosphingobium sp. JCM 18896]|uniref:L,D-transpeptidase family protein n=1 Tax=Novosphingobium sp. JCM 18896 TaxID=2989731 RepID=UPI0022232FE3|nr:L,D-transpeptidase family protein [Novosphingobium sp. JCM 18896]MCW1430564.1 L,D-transpeptidase family protein [Novosphingobium sp. JCM 18896]
MTRGILLVLGAAALVPTGAAPLLAKPAPTAPSASAALRAEIAERAGSDLRGFYAARGNRPLWVAADGAAPAARLLLDQLQSAERDRIRPGKVKASALERALDAARGGSAEDVAKAEIAASNSYVAYVKALRSGKRAAMIYESEALRPALPTATSALQTAARAGSLETHVRTMAWMHPLYAPLRKALDDDNLSEQQRSQIALNLDRLRAIPANPARRYVLVDTASARLWMYQDGRPAATMRVVVGKPEEAMQTPTMAGYIRYAVINPYWNVPPDLVRSRVAWNVNTKGPGYLSSGGYQVMSDWTDQARPIDPTRIDWRAVEAGDGAPPRVRQLPGGSNFMGTVKFMFPNEQGIYLHDTPDKDLLRKDARQFSSGCVRLEDAPRLGRWLMNRPLPRRPRGDPEQRLALPELVPVYITYLTAMPEGGRIAFRDDVYARDRLGGDTRLARSDRSRADRP